MIVRALAPCLVFVCSAFTAMFFAAPSAPNLGMTQLASRTDREEMTDLVRAQIELESARKEILAKSQSDYRKQLNLNVQTNSSQYVVSRNEASALAGDRRLDELRDLLNDLKSRKEPVAKLVTEFKSLTGRQDFKGCIGLLARMDFNLASKLVDPKPSLADNAVLDLQKRNFTCQRAIGTWKGRVRFDGMRIASCFASEAKAVARKLGVQVTIAPALRHLAQPRDNNNPVTNAEAKALGDFVATFPDYQMKPWDIYRYCLEKTGARVVHAASLCYGALRLNRGRPDIARKYLDIRGDRAAGGDNSGDWYHLFGMMRASLAWGGLTKTLYGMDPNTVGDDTAERRNDLAGADLGLAMADALSSPASEIPPEKACTLGLFSYSKK